MARFLLAAFAAVISAGPAGAQFPAALTDEDFHPPAAAATVELGRQLFFDKILSGSFNIACATCHHPFAGTGDGLSLSVGEGARGTGIVRDTGSGIDAIRERVPRNAPALFNLGAREFSTLFHDGRVSPDRHAPSGFASPAGVALPPGLDNVLAVQAMFPVTSGTEMAGEPGENPVADAAARGDLPAVWELLAARLREVDAYVAQFVAAFDDVNAAGDITFVHVANAIAAFEAVAWRADNSAFDRFLRGDRLAMSATQRRGMRLFYGRAGCSGCHAGALQTDHSFRAIAMPQVGPGKGDGPGGYEDFGRERVTGKAADRYRFRVPSLRNVALTAPYGHAGAYDTLDAAVRHHLDPVAALRAFDVSQVVLPSRPDLDEQDRYALDSEATMAAIAAANELSPIRLRERDIAALVAFLHALTDPAMLDLRRDVPRAVPSGLPLAD
jgi:cytochrome c peroxidase